VRINPYEPVWLFFAAIPKITTGGEGLMPSLEAARVEVKRRKADYSARGIIEAVHYTIWDQTHTLKIEEG
jgi:hypothetical protein